MRPVGWEVDADEVLGTDAEGRTYYRLRGDVYVQQAGATRWVSTLAAWNSFRRMYAPTFQTAV